MDTSILIFGEGAILPLCHSSPASTQRQLKDLQGDLKRMPRTFLHQKLRDRRWAAAPLCRIHELFAFISIPCYLSSQDWGPFIILTVMARSNLHCQRLKPMTSSNSISCTGTKQKLIRWLRPQSTATLVLLPYQDGPTDGKARFPGHVKPTIAVSTIHSRIWPCLLSQSLQVEYYASHGLVTLTFLYCSYKAKTVLKSSPQTLPF